MLRRSCTNTEQRAKNANKLRGFKRNSADRNYDGLLEISRVFPNGFRSLSVAAGTALQGCQALHRRSTLCKSHREDLFKAKRRRQAGVRKFSSKRGRRVGAAGAALTTKSALHPGTQQELCPLLKSIQNCISFTCFPFCDENNESVCFCRLYQNPGCCMLIQRNRDCSHSGTDRNSSQIPFVFSGGRAQNGAAG